MFRDPVKVQDCFFFLITLVNKCVSAAKVLLTVDSFEFNFLRINSKLFIYFLRNDLNGLKLVIN